MALKDLFNKVKSKVKAVASSVAANTKNFVTGVTQVLSGNIVGGISSVVEGVSNVVSDVKKVSNSTTKNTSSTSASKTTISTSSNSGSGSVAKATEQILTTNIVNKSAKARGLADNDYTKLTDLLLA